MTIDMRVTKRLRVRSVLLLVCMLTAVPSERGLAQDARHGVQEFTESGTWRVPSGVTHIIVELWGAGGGGASGTSAVSGGSDGPGGGGGGGGSGAYVRASLSVTEGETYIVKIGTGGSGGSRDPRSGPQRGVDGGETTFERDGKVLLAAAGGRGGNAPKQHHTKGGPGGMGGPAEAVTTRLVRAGNHGLSGQEGGLPESHSSFGGAGGAPVLGTVSPPGSFGGAGGPGLPSGQSEDGKRGGSGSLVITW
jgi:hypothetical protein